MITCFLVSIPEWNAWAASAGSPSAAGRVRDGIQKASSCPLSGAEQVTKRHAIVPFAVRMSHGDVSITFAQSLSMG